MLQYSTLQHQQTNGHLTANNIQSNSQMNCICGNSTGICTNNHCGQSIIQSHPFLNPTTAEITLESFDGNTATLNRRTTIPVSILLSHNSTNHQLNQMTQTPNLMMNSLNSPLTCGHLSTFMNRHNSTILNSIDRIPIDQSSNTSVDQTTTTNSIEQNPNKNRVFFIHTSNTDNEPTSTDAFIQQTTNPILTNQFNTLHSKVQITDSNYDDKMMNKNEQETNQSMLYLKDQSNVDQYDYYKMLNRTPMFDAYVSESNYELNYNGLEILTSPYLHDQVVTNLNNDCDAEKLHHLDNFEKEVTIGSNMEQLDGKIESNQSNNNKTVSSFLI